MLNQKCSRLISTWKQFLKQSRKTLCRFWWTEYRQVARYIMRYSRPSFLYPTVFQFWSRIFHVLLFRLKALAQKKNIIDMRVESGRWKTKMYMRFDGCRRKSSFRVIHVQRQFVTMWAELFVDDSHCSHAY